MIALGSSQPGGPWQAGAGGYIYHPGSADKSEGKILISGLFRDLHVWMHGNCSYAHFKILFCVRNNEISKVPQTVSAVGVLAVYLSPNSLSYRGSHGVAKGPLDPS